MREFVIKENDSDQRVDKFIQKSMKTMPKSLMYKYIRNKKIKVNNKRCVISQRLLVGDTMQCYIAEEFFEDTNTLEFLQVPAKINVIYEDEHVLIVDKEKGLLAHRDEVGVQDNLADRILHYLYDKKEYDPKMELSFTPALCHRIDRNTRGVVIAAKSAMALREVNMLIKERRITKKYICMVEGVVENREERVLLYHKKMEGNKADIRTSPCEGYKEMESIYRVLKRGKHYSLLEVELLSGKSHQIRAMMAHLHHPLVGDVKYGANQDGKKTYQELCAYKVEFHCGEESTLGYLNNRVFTLQDEDMQKRFVAQYETR
ncbi:MAG: RluA family pseudouridine synthase [Longicatena sp.]